MSEPLSVSPENARTMWDWIQSRGGLKIWQSADLCDPSASMTTPSLTKDMQDYPSPGWKFPTPTRHITATQDVVVTRSTILEEIRCGLERGDGFRINLTAGARRKMDRAVARWEKKHPGRQIWWAPTGDLMTPSCVVLMDEQPVPLADYIADHGGEENHGS